MSYALVDNSYGKSSIRLAKVTRHADRHEFKEMSVDILLNGEFEQSYLRGDNSRVVTTDTMKNTVYALASAHPVDSIEGFAVSLADHFLSEYAHVELASISVTENLFTRILHAGAPHAHAFTGGSEEKRVTYVDTARGGAPQIESGIENLVVLKTANSEFSGFINDRYTTLHETNDRIFATAISANWTFESHLQVGLGSGAQGSGAMSQETSAGPKPDAWQSDRQIDYNAVYNRSRAALLNVFCEHHSFAVQQTLFQMGQRVLAECPEIAEVRIEMPNQHRVPFDLEPLGMENSNSIFVPIAEPFGLISGTVARSASPVPKTEKGM